MQIYLPIAELPVNVLLILFMGLAVGVISGMFGIGGGFLMTPLLIFIGIAPAVAVASVASHVAASSFSGAISYWRRRALDPVLATMLIAAGLIGTTAGVALFTLLRRLGQLDLTIAVSYLLLLGIVGTMMVTESVRAIMRSRGGRPAEIRRPGSHLWIHGLPLKMRFKVSKIYVSVIPIWVIGFGIGFIGAVMGIGGGFMLVPALIYLIRVPTGVVIGTSMVLTLVTMAYATVIHAATNHLVDALLALMLMIGGVIGAQFGARAGQRFSGEQLRLLLGAVGTMMIVESVRAILRARGGRPAEIRRPGSHLWIHGLPLKMRFKTSKIYVSVIPIITIGFLIGFIGAVMGIGGGFLLVPALIYLIRVPTGVVIGTSMVLTLVTMAYATIIHAATNHLVDALLALMLMIGGVIGAQFGARAGQRFSGEQLRLLLGVLVLSVGQRFAYDLVVPPTEQFTIRTTEEQQP